MPPGALVPTAGCTVIGGVALTRCGLVSRKSATMSCPARATVLRLRLFLHLYPMSQLEIALRVNITYSDDAIAFGPQLELKGGDALESRAPDNHALRIADEAALAERYTVQLNHRHLAKPDLHDSVTRNLQP